MSRFALGTNKPRRPSLGTVHTYTSTENQTNYTFSSADLGPAIPRAIGVFAGGRSTGSRTVSALTVGETELTFVRRSNWNSGGNGTHLEFWIGLVPVGEGESADIAVNWSAAMNNCGIAVVPIYDLSSLTETGGDDATGDNQTLDVVVPIRGIVLAGSTVLLTAPSCTWTGVTEIWDAAIESGNNTYFSGGSYIATAAETRAVTADWNTTPGNVASVAVGLR